MIKYFNTNLLSRKILNGSESNSTAPLMYIILWGAMLRLCPLKTNP